MTTLGWLLLVVFPGRLSTENRTLYLTPWWAVLLGKGLTNLPGWIAEFRAKKVEVMKKELAVLENVEVGESKVA